MKRLNVLFGLCLLGLFTRGLCAATVTGAAQPGVWSYSLAAARQLADDTDRPLVVMFSNSSGACYWCNRFEREINASDTWNAYATEQQLAMATIDYNGPNWDEAYYLTFYSTSNSAPEVTGFPAFVIYAGGTTNVLSAFSYISTNLFTAADFVARVNTVLKNNNYRIEQSENDLWDPADNTDVGATILDFKSYNQRQHHTLNKTPEDTDDWFKFLCVSGRKYQLGVPAIDYTIAFSRTDLTNQSFSTTNRSLGLPVTNSVTTIATTNLSASVTNTTVLVVVTNFDPIVIGFVTNNLPMWQLRSSTTNPPVTEVLSLTLTNGQPSAVVTTNLPRRVVAVTNGTPPEIISPSFQILDPTRQIPLTVMTGLSEATNSLLLADLTNGCVFTPAAPYNNSYCFIRISQVISNTPPSFDTVEYLYPQTNFTVTTTLTNLTNTTVTRQTVTNEWLSLTYSGPTNLFTDEGRPSGFWSAVIVATNHVVETFTLTVTNGLTTALAQAATNTVISGGTNSVTYAYDSTKYALNYRFWEPGEVGFSATNVRISESAASVRLTVTRKGGTTGPVSLRYRFEDAATPGRDYEAESGKDFKAVEGDLFWADGQSGSTNITVGLIQDLRPTWEGDERFAVVLSKHADAEHLQAPVNAWSNAVITLAESAKKNAGSFGFSAYEPADGSGLTTFANAAKPALTVTEGDAVTLWVARTGGSDGPARLRVVSVNGAARAPADFDALSETLEWEDGDSDPQSVTLQTVDRDPFNRDATFTVKLVSELNAPLSSAATVTVTLRDADAALGLADTAAAAAQYGAAFSASSGYWFWSDPDTLRCESLPQKGQKAALRLTVTGPGVLTFGSEASNGTLAWSGGTDNTLLLKAGKQTVTWTFTRTLPTDPDVDAYAAIHTLKWYPLLKAHTPVPESGARTSATSLSWELPTHPAVALGGDFAIDEADTLDADLTSTLVAVSPSAPSATDALPPVFFEDLWPTLLQPQPGRTYTWRVDTVYRSDAGTLARTGDVWSFTALNPDTGDDTQLPPGADANGLCEALQGVFCDFDEIPGEPGSTYAVVVGKLPPGLSLAKATGRISGVPTQAGTWSFLLQATAPGRIPYATAALTVTVYPLGSFAGTYDGWVTTGAESESCGSVTLALTEKGALTAKVAANGTTYSFSKTGLDETDSASEPTTVGVTVYGTVFTASDGRHTNTLAVTLDAEGSVTGTLTLYALVKTNATTEAASTEYEVQLYRNNWSEGHMQPVLDVFKGYYTVSLPLMAANDASNTPWGSGYATLTVVAKGGVKLSGVLADGQAWSQATTLLVPDTNDVSSAFVYVYAQPSAYAKNGGFCGRLRINAGESLYGNTVDCPDTDPELLWWNHTPTSVYGATGPEVTETSGFFNRLGAAGGYYDTVMNLQTYYLRKLLSFEDAADFPAADAEPEPDPDADPDNTRGLSDRLPPDYDGTRGISNYLLLSDPAFLPFGTNNIVVGAQALSASAKKVVTNGTDSATHSLTNCIEDVSINVPGLTLSLTRATGLLAGSFDLVYERENANGLFVRRTRKVAYKGIHTPVRPGGGEADDPGESVQGAGFYLIPDTGAYLDSTGRARTYPFNWSFGFDLRSTVDP